MINVVLMNLPNRIKAVHVNNSDGSHTIVLNKQLNWEQQQEGYGHEMAHINNDDISSADDVELIELLAHGYN